MSKADLALVMGEKCSTPSKKMKKGKKGKMMGRMPSHKDTGTDSDMESLSAALNKNNGRGLKRH